MSCRQAQLRVTNGCTGDGYYVRPLAKLMPKLTKLSPPSKYQSSYQPNGSHWESETQKATDADCVKTRKCQPNGISHNTNSLKTENKYISDVGSSFPNNLMTIAQSYQSSNLLTNPTQSTDTTTIKNLPNRGSEYNNDLDSSTEPPNK